jgi:hypothetical protein
MNRFMHLKIYTEKRLRLLRFLRVSKVLGFASDQNTTYC